MVSADTQSQLDRIQSLVEQLAAQRPLSPVVDIDEAMVLTRCRSKSAFYRWCRRAGIRTCAPGRYARDRIMAALRKEARAL